MQRHELIGAINDLLRKFGVQLSGYGPAYPLFQLRRAIRDPQVSVLIDAGANTGQYGKSVRKIRKDLIIHSFEPQARAYAALKEAAFGDNAWYVHHMGLGSESASIAMNVSENDQCSSLLAVGETHLAAAPRSKVIGKEIVMIDTLDAVMKDEFGQKFLKIDCQGYEAEIVKGAKETLKSTLYVQMEASLVPLYDAAPTISELLDQMADCGFELMTLLPGFADHANARLLQADLVFVKRSSDYPGAAISS